MEAPDRKEHWEKVYGRKPLHEMSWYQETPRTSMEFFTTYNVGLQDKIIDIGGGDSLLVDKLLDAGYMNITVLDISARAIERAKQRLGNRADQVTWIESDILEFTPKEKYDCWHDRATFHFLTEDDQIDRYLTIASASLRPGGILIMGTFSEEGPETCSGLPIRKYSPESMTDKLKAFFEKIRCITIDHQTPFNTLQRFVFCSFRKPR